MRATTATTASLLSRLRWLMAASAACAACAIGRVAAREGLTAKQTSSVLPEVREFICKCWRDWRRAERARGACRPRERPPPGGRRPLTRGWPRARRRRPLAARAPTWRDPNARFGGTPRFRMDPKVLEEPQGFGGTPRFWRNPKVLEEPHRFWRHLIRTCLFGGRRGLETWGRGAVRERAGARE